MTNEEFMIVERKGDVADQNECRLITRKSFLNLISSVQLATGRYFEGDGSSSSLANQEENVKISLFRHITTGNILSNVVESFDKTKCLFVPNWNESDHTSLFVDDSASEPLSKSNIGGMMGPICAKYFQTKTQWTVALPSGNSLWKSLYAHFGVEVIECNKQYTMATDDWTCTPPADTTYDCVVLYGIDTEGNTYSSSDVKGDFSDYVDISSVKLLDYHEDHAVRTKLHEGKTVAQAKAEGVEVATRISDTPDDLDTVLNFSNTNTIPANHHNNTRFAALVAKVLPSQQQSFKAY